MFTRDGRVDLMFNIEAMLFESNCYMFIIWTHLFVALRDNDNWIAS